jgi:hypothetical protein
MKENMEEHDEPWNLEESLRNTASSENLSFSKLTLVSSSVWSSG